MKRVISLILSIAMVASLCTGLAVTGFAAVDDEFVVGNIKYKVTREDPKEVKVVNNSYTGDITIPATVTDTSENEYTVTGIGASAFWFCDNLTSVIIPDSVTTIGSNAFGNCSKLTSVIIPDSVTTIDLSAFLNCSGLTSVTIGSGVTTIGVSVFSGCKGLTSVTIPDKVESIGKYAFENCTSLTDATFKGTTPPTVTGGAPVKSPFSGCTNLTAIYIPAGSLNEYKNWLVNYGYNGSIEVMPQPVGYTFNDDTNNLKYTVTESGKVSVEKKGTSSIEKPTGDLVIPTTVTDADGNEYTVTSIGQQAFWYCTELTSVIIPDSVTTIGNNAFGKCFDLTSVIIPDSVTTIEYNAFTECSGLTSVIIPDSVTTIGSGVFSDCKGLTSITIPDKVTSIGINAFLNCTSLTDATFKGTTPPTITDGPITGNNYPFAGCNDLTAIYVPKDSVEAYKNSDWGIYNYYKQIIQKQLDVGLQFSGTKVKIIGTDTFDYYATAKEKSPLSGNDVNSSLSLTKGYFYTITASDKTFYINYVVKEIAIQANSSELEADITQADALISKVITNTNKYLPTSKPDGNVYTTVEAYNAFNKAITNAKTVKNNSSHTQLEIDDALININGALRTFISTLRADTWYVNNGEITHTDNFNGNEVFTEEAFGTLDKVEGADYKRVQSTLKVKVGDYTYSATYYLYASAKDENAYIEAFKPQPKPVVLPITITANNANGTFTISYAAIDKFKVRGVYYGLGTELTDADYFGLINGATTCAILGNGTHTFKVLATSKETGETKIYKITANATYIEPVVINQNGVVFINTNGTNPSKVYYTDTNSKVVYVPIADDGMIKLDANDFTEINTIMFDEKAVEIKVYPESN